MTGRRPGARPLHRKRTAATVAGDLYYHSRPCTLHGQGRAHGLHVPVCAANQFPRLKNGDRTQSVYVPGLPAQIPGSSRALRSVRSYTAESGLGGPRVRQYRHSEFHRLVGGNNTPFAWALTSSELRGFDAMTPMAPHKGKVQTMHLKVRNLPDCSLHLVMRRLPGCLRQPRCRPAFPFS